MLKLIRKYTPVFRHRLDAAQNRVEALETYACLLEQYVDRRVVITDGKRLSDHEQHADVVVISGDGITIDRAMIKSPGTNVKVVLKDCRNLTLLNSSIIGDAPAHPLAAAAPDLLALLKELIDIEGPQPGTAEWAQRVQATISRIEGGAPCHS